MHREEATDLKPEGTADHNGKHIGWIHTPLGIQGFTSGHTMTVRRTPDEDFRAARSTYMLHDTEWRDTGWIDRHGRAETHGDSRHRRLSTRGSVAEGKQYPGTHPPDRQHFTQTACSPLTARSFSNTLCISRLAARTERAGSAAGTRRQEDRWPDGHVRKKTEDTRQEDRRIEGQMDTCAGEQEDRGHEAGGHGGTHNKRTPTSYDVRVLV